MPTFLTHLHLNRIFQNTAFKFACAYLCALCVCASPSPRADVHGCAFTSQFMRICDFLRYICSKASIWCAGLDLVASNKLLFQCCLCSGLHHRQLCGWPPVPPQGEPYIGLVWVTAHLLQLSDTRPRSGASSCQASKQLWGLTEIGWFKWNSDFMERLISWQNVPERLHMMNRHGFSLRTSLCTLWCLINKKKGLTLS